MISTRLLELISAFVLGALIAASGVVTVKNMQLRAALADQQQGYDHALTLARNARDAAEAHATEVEHQRALEIASIETRHQEEMGLQNATKDKIIADLRTGRQRLLVNTKPACGGTVSGAEPSTSFNIDPTRSELSQDVAERLVQRASLADEITLQLQACQRVLVSDRSKTN